MQMHPKKYPDRQRASATYARLAFAFMITQVLASTQLHAQATNALKAPSQLLEDVLQYRRGWIERDMTVDACSFYRLMQTSPDAPKQMPAWVKTLVGYEGANPCVPTTAAPAKNRSASVLRYDSVSVGATTARVYATVMNGENVHREDFTASFMAADRRWAVQEVRVWDALRVYKR